MGKKQQSTQFSITVSPVTDWKTKEELHKELRDWFMEQTTPSPLGRQEHAEPVTESVVVGGGGR